MFMPQKNNTQENQSLDSQEELRKLSGNEIWELTQKAAVHDYKKTAQLMRQQFANEMMEQYAEDELGYVLAEALGLDGEDDPPARIHSN